MVLVSIRPVPREAPRQRGANFVRRPDRLSSVRIRWIAQQRPGLLDGADDGERNLHGCAQALRAQRPTTVVTTTTARSNPRSTSRRYRSNAGSSDGSVRTGASRISINTACCFRRSAGSTRARASVVASMSPSRANKRRPSVACIANLSRAAKPHGADSADSIRWSQRASKAMRAVKIGSIDCFRGDRGRCFQSALATP